MLLRSSVATFIGLLALTSRGTAMYTLIANHCPHPIYVWSVAHADKFISRPMKVAPGQGYYEPYRSPIGGGVSIKIGDHPGTAAGAHGPITQFEYRYEPTGEVYYDVSNIDCNTELGECPFTQYGLYVDAGPCPSFFCWPGLKYCDHVYNHPNDIATKYCTYDQVITLNLCLFGVALDEIMQIVSEDKGVSHLKRPI